MMEYKKAHSIAISILKKLESCCEKVDIAGSVAREKDECKDIEIVCSPCMVTNKDLFGNLDGEPVRASFFCSAVRSLGVILKGKPEDGRYIQVALPEGINLDLFIPQFHDYYRQYAIRIGSKDYSHKVLATAWNKLGWVGTPDGLRKMSECYSKEVNGKKHWICNVPQPTLPPVWKNEYYFFQWLGISWIEPKNRI